METILYISFDDSFDNNILSYLSEYDLCICHYSKLFELEMSKFKAVILGPGPGYVSEYSSIYNFIQTIYASKIPLLGICLGHQLILSVVFSFDIIRCKRPIHGQAVKLTINSKDYLVQRYNSWTCVSDKDFDNMYFDEFGELSLFQQDNVLTMQFHPESVGTSCPKLFFEMIDHFLVHNSIDGYFANKNKWHIRQKNN